MMQGFAVDTSKHVNTLDRSTKKILNRTRAEQSPVSKNCKKY